MTIKIFKYIDQLDCFIVNPAYKKIADRLGLTEWNEVVWIGRYFSLDNDNGEHWFDNWDLKDKVEEKAKKLGLNYDELLILDPDRFKNSSDGPCHSDIERKRFWTDVLKSLELSIETIVGEAQKFNNDREKTEEKYIADLDERISEVKNAC
jgi:hypothetical protein